MQQVISNKEFSIKETFKDAITLVETIKNYIHEHDCPDLSMDISYLNIIDASRVTVLCSTYHWSKYPDGKISWLINSEDIKDIVKPLNLGNINLITVR
ncbi:MAG: hypothetical protein WCG95_03975 [bacterium]